MDSDRFVRDIHAAIQLQDLSSAALASVLEETAKLTARSPDLRHEFHSQSVFWNDMNAFWEHAPAAIIDGDNAAVADSALNCARLLRNLCAGVEENQINTILLEPALRRLLHHLTSFHQVASQSNAPLLQALVQTLSNALTGGTPEQDNLWVTYIELPPEQNIIARLMAVKDLKTLEYAGIMVVNAISGSPSRQKRLASKSGIVICKAMLEALVTLADEHLEDQQERVFNTLYSAFRTLFGEGYLSSLWALLQTQIELTAHQVVLLKLFDAFVQSSSRPSIQNPQLCASLIEIYQELLVLADESIPQDHAAAQEQAVGDSLSVVMEGLILSSQSLANLLLDEREAAIRARCVSAVAVVENSQKPLIQPMIVVLRRLDKFLPRVILGRAQSASNPPLGHPVSSEQGISAFAYVKRDIVKLLGVLCYEDKLVQDRIRDCEGIQLVMNMCVVDERNPYLREHALFTLRNLLRDNPDNQAVVNQFKPMVEWDPEGTLKSTS